MLHHIQKGILDNLATAHSSRYSDLKPPDMDGNIFSYHLKLLLTDRYVLKNDDGLYVLSPKGKDYVVHRYENPLLQAHSIFLIVLRRGDQWLLRERLVQPLLGMSGFIHGEPIANESVIETAERRLHDKTGIKITLHIHSSGLVRISQDSIITSYSHAIILVGNTDEDMTVTSDPTGRNYWGNAMDLAKEFVLPSCSSIVERVVSNNITPFELAYEL